MATSLPSLPSSSLMRASNCIASLKQLQTSSFSATSLPPAFCLKSHQCRWFTASAPSASPETSGSNNLNPSRNSTSTHKVNEPARRKGDEAKRQPWQRWINLDSPFTGLSDELNRMRHYFWRIDSKGRLLRRELNTPRTTVFGELRAPMIKDQLLAAIQHNRTGNYVSSSSPNGDHEQYPFLAMRLHEHNFIQSDELSPIYFHDLIDTSNGSSLCSPSSSSSTPASPSSPTFHLVFGSALRLPFHPDQLFFSQEGKLYHPYFRSEVIFDPTAYPTKSPYPITIPAIPQEEDPPILGLLESTLAQAILSRIEEDTMDISSSSSSSSSSFASPSGLILYWRDGHRYPIRVLNQPSSS